MSKKIAVNTPEPLAQRLRTEAARRGVPVASLAAIYLARGLEMTTAEAKLTALEEAVCTHREKLVEIVNWVKKLVEARS